MEQDDLISVGTIGLIKAIDTFNAGKGARLATYAARCIDNEILMYFRNQKKTAQDVSMSEVMLFLGTMCNLNRSMVIRRRTPQTTTCARLPPAYPLFTTICRPIFLTFRFPDDTIS